MRIRFPLSITVVACALLILSCGKPAMAEDAADNSEIGLLRQTYNTLKVANHDYDGHRVKAMRAIEAACDLLGTNIRGYGKSGEKSQTVSDDELRLAQKNLLHAHTMASEQKQKEVVVHLDEAVDQLAKALAVK